MEKLKHLVILMDPGQTHVYAEMILACGDDGITLLVELCHRILEG